MVKNDSKGYNYNYMSLPTLLKNAREVLSKHRLGFLQCFKEKNVLVTTIFSVEPKEGVVSESSFTLPEFSQLMSDSQSQKRSLAQEMGSVITYFRRYCLATSLGVQPDKDDDAAVKQSGSGYSRPAYSKPGTSKPAFGYSANAKKGGDPGPAAPPF